jgi:glycine cleavage system H protein
VQIPDSLKYSKDHEWARVKEAGVIQVGITDYAQQAMGDIVFVELPQPGDGFAAGEVFGSLESVKAVSQCYLPVGGTVTAVNESLLDSPELVNKDPYGDGWLVELKVADQQELAGLLTAGDYQKHLSSLED